MLRSFEAPRRGLRVWEESGSPEPEAKCVRVDPDQDPEAHERAQDGDAEQGRAREEPALEAQPRAENLATVFLVLHLDPERRPRRGELPGVALVHRQERGDVEALV